MRVILRVTVAALVWSGSLGPALAHGCGHQLYDHSCHGPCSCGAEASRRSGTGAAAGWAADLRTIEGKIVEVIYLPGGTPDMGMVDIKVQTNSGTSLLVRLAPTGFLKQGGLRLQEGDPMTVKAFTVAGMNGDVMVATEVTCKGTNMRLRGSSGQPLW